MINNICGKICNIAGATECQWVKDRLQHFPGSGIHIDLAGAINRNIIFDPVEELPVNALDQQELIEHSREWIAGYKVPKSVEFRDEPLPLSGAMKVLKKDLRDPYWEGHARRVN